MKRQYVLGIDLGTKLGVATLDTDGNATASTHKLESTMNGRVRGLAGIIKRHATAECMGVCIEEPFSGQFSSVKALFPMMGAAVLACEEAGLPYSIIHLSKLKIHATGKGNAQKDAMIAAAKARFGLDLDDNAADALWASAYALDHNLFQQPNESQGDE